MKGKSLLKKIGAVATTVAMIASVGVTGFANVEYNGTDLAGKPIMATETTTAGIYKVEIPYKSTVANTIGVTMLSYAAAEHAGFENANTPYADTMQIVGVDQINAGDATNGIGVDGTGTFTFYVDTNGEDTEGTIRMNRGERGIVLLSGDAAASATGYLFQVGRMAGVVTVEGAGGEVNEPIAVRPSDGSGAAYIKTFITTTPYSVQLNGTTVTETDKITVTAKGADYDAANWQAQNVVYTVSINDDSIDVTAAEITVAYEANPANATEIMARTMEFPKADVVDTNLAGAVRGKISTVTFQTDKGEKTVSVPQSAIEVENQSAFDPEAYVNQICTVQVKVLGGQYGEVKVPEGGLTADYVITVTAQDTRKEITEVTFGAANTLTIENADAPADLAGIEAKVKAHVEAGGVKVNGTADYPVAELQYVTSDSYTKPEGSDAATVTYTVTAPANVNIDGYKWAADAQDATFTVTVTVKGAAPAYMLGDVNGDDSVDVMDASAVQMYAFFNTPLTILEAGDVNGDESVDVMDASAIQMYAFFNTPFPTSN